MYTMKVFAAEIFAVIILALHVGEGVNIFKS
jgi:hypothetical protein